MGLYNLNPKLIKNHNLNSNVCPICQTSEIHPIVDGAKDSFDYICNQCRPSYLISISGSALNSEYLDNLDDDLVARIELQADIRQCEEKDYPLLIDTLSYFLRIEKAYDYRTYTFIDWNSGQLGSNLDLFKNIAVEEMELIVAKQEEIFSKHVEKLYNDLLIDLETRMQRSIRQDELLKYELASVKLLLHGAINMVDEIVDLGTLKLPLDEITKIQKYYHDAVNGKLDLRSVPGPNQKTRVGTSRSETQYKAKAIAFEKYLNFLEKNIKKTSNSKTKPQERMEYLRILYNECQGNSSATCNLTDIGEKIDLDEIESRNISHTLMDLGYVEILTKEGHIKITASGILKIEELEADKTDKNNDTFSNEELKNLNLKIDAIIEYLEKLDLGHEVIFEEIESLRNDAQKLSKKDFKSMALGKLFNLGIDGLLSQTNISEILKNLIGSDFNKYLK